MSSIISKMMAEARLKMTFCRHMGLKVWTDMESWSLEWGS